MSRFRKVLLGLFTIPEMDIALGIQVITLIGVIFTIILSKRSLNQQNRAAARESIEQLDDLELSRPTIKLKPILHRYSPWPRSVAEVKLKIYNPTEISGLSKEYPYFVAFPAYTFKDYEVKTVEDGYLLTINSASAVDLRRVTERLLADIGDIAQQKENSEWMEYDIFESNYEPAMNGIKLQIHDDILELLNDGNPRSREVIREKLSQDNGHNSKIVNLAFSDLLMTGEIIQADGSDQYTTPEPPAD